MKKEKKKEESFVALLACAPSRRIQYSFLGNAAAACLCAVSLARARMCDSKLTGNNYFLEICPFRRLIPAKIVKKSCTFHSLILLFTHQFYFSITDFQILGAI